jgi:transposase
MNQSVVLDAVYLPVIGRREPARSKRRRKSKLDAQISVIEQWLLLRAESKNKLNYSQRLLVARLKKERGVSVSQAAFSRFCAARGLEGVFHEKT